MSRKLRRSVEKAQAMDVQPIALLALIRKSRTGYIGVIEEQGKDVIVGTVNGPSYAEALSKAVDFMQSECAEVTGMRVLVEGKK